MKVNRSSYKGVEELERPLSLCLSISLSLGMPGRALLRTALLLWLAQPTLQGGTGRYTHTQIL